MPLRPFENHLNWQPYPEEIKETPFGQLEVEVFQPRDIQVVMGASGKPHLEVYEQELAHRGVALFKRKGGGGTVVLGPGVIVVTIHAGVGHPFRNGSYFKAINQAIIQVFKSWKALPFTQRGISDIALQGKKLVGTSIFRRKSYLLYQASILVSFDPQLIETLLRHPPREPDYRQGRSHQDFVMDLRKAGIDTPIETLMDDLRIQLPQSLPSLLKAVDKMPI